MNTFLKIITFTLTLSGLGLFLSGISGVDGGALLSNPSAFFGFFLTIFGGMVAVTLTSENAEWSYDVSRI